MRNAEIFVESRIIEDWKQTQHEETVDKGSFEDVLDRIIRDHSEEIRRLAKHNFGWSDSTVESSISFLTNSVAKKIKDQWTNMSDVADVIIEESKCHGNHTGEEEQLLRGLQNKMLRAKRLFSLLKEEYDVLEEYDLNFPMIFFGQAAQREQIKTVDKAVRSTYLYALLELAKKGVALAFGAAMMYFVGLRTGEALAPLLGDIEISANGKYALYFVNGQIKKGKWTRYLKTDQSHRLVVLPYGMVRFVQLRIQELRDKGYSEAKIAKIPLVSFTDEEKAYVHEKFLSRFSRELHELCGGPKEGYHRENVAGAEQCEIKNSGSISAYEERREFASRCICCGITPAELDQLMAHKSAERGYETVLAQVGTERWKNSIAGKLERYVICPELSMSPAIVPVNIQRGDMVRLQGGAVYILEAGEDCTVNFKVQNVEANDHLSLTTGGCFSESELHWEREYEDPKSRPYRMPSFSVVPDEQELDRYREQGRKIAEEMMKERAWING